MKDRVLIIGSGGREHALGWKIAQSDQVSEVIYAPGNGGTAAEYKARNISIDATKKENFQKIADLIRQESIDLVVVGPEQPLVDGIVDFLHEQNYYDVIGCTADQAKLEADKFHSGRKMREWGVPQADFIECTSDTQALDAIETMMTFSKKPSEGIVLKARGLTGGKGVSVFNTQKEIFDPRGEMNFEKHIAAFGSELLVSQRLVGEEYSFIVLADGNTALPMGIYQDHKRRHVGDEGKNTGGMGAYGGSNLFKELDVNYVIERIINPVIRHTEYRGILYAGLMNTSEGPKVLEYNVRFGDPECQPAMTLFDGDLYETLKLANEGKLHEASPKMKCGAACTVVVAADGYPDNVEKNIPLTGLWHAANVPGVKIFHSGTRVEGEQYFSTGGRILTITGYGKDLVEAQGRAMIAASRIGPQDRVSYRPDIGYKGLPRR